MQRWTNTRNARMIALLAIVWITVACAPLDDDGSSSTGCAGLNITSDGGTNSQIPLLTSPAGTTNSLAQPFIATTTTSITSIAIKLETISTAVPATQLAGVVTVAIEADASASATSPTPTQPSGVKLGSGTESMSSIALNQAQFYSIPVTASLTSGLVYWVIVYASVGTYPSGYIGWNGSSGIAYAQSPAYSYPSTGTSYTALTQNLDVQLGCN